jgi:hypothetical protein
MLDKPQLPRPVAVVKGTTWADIWNGIATLSKQNQNLVQYLQHYLTLVYNRLVPPKVNVSVVVSPYTVNATDAFVAATAGPVQLPPTNGSGRVITIKNIDPSNAPVAITPYGSDAIDGGGAGAPYLLAPEFQVVSLVDGQAGQWWIY